MWFQGNFQPMPMTTETKWIKDHRGNLVSFDQVYEGYFQPIFNYILHRVANVAEAEDLTAQTFFKAFQNLWRFRWSGSSIGNWLYRISTNEVNGFFRKQRRRKHESLATEEELTDPRQSSAREELEEAERELGRNRIFLDLNASIRELNSEEQALLTLRYFEKKSFTEIAQILNKRQGTLGMRTHRALKKLKQKLQLRGIDHEKIRGCFEEPAPAGYQGRQVQAKLAP